MSLYAITKKLLFGAAFLLFASFAIGDRYPDHAVADKTTVTVNVVWLPSFAATDRFCQLPKHDENTIVYACYNPEKNTIYAVQPSSFNDHFKLEVLGHEFWHALGARHPD